VADTQSVTKAHALLSSALLTACLADPPGVDLDGPQIVSSTLPDRRSVDVPVVPELVVELSEPIDPASVHPGSVALVGWELLDERCDLSPICEDGTCERGVCQVESLRASDRAALERGEFDASLPAAAALEFELADGEAGPDTRLHIRPRAPLDVHRRYSLVIGPAVRDRSGAPLVDEWGRAVAWQRDFVTAGIGSGGPEPQLFSPRPGQLDVPTNLGRIDTQIWPPIWTVDDATTLLLEAEDGSAAIELLEPQRCPGWVPGTCLRWRVTGELAASTRYRPVGGTLVDRLGRGVVGPGSSRETWFRTGAGADVEPPQAQPIAVVRTRCVAVWIDAGEPVEAELAVGDLHARAAIDGRGWIGVELDGLAPDDPIAWTLALRDLADNHATWDGSVAAGPSFAADVPRLRITEVLANPSGPEPDGEFVELLAGPEGALLDGVMLSDLSLAELRDVWASGDDPPGDPLPTIELGPGELVIVAGSAWAESVPAHVQVIVSDASLGRGGLKNAGEPVTLWRASELGPVALASYANWIDSSAGSHDGRSVVAGADGCDLPDRWRAHPLGTASPGTLP
jgi:hypothetical protein